MNATISGPVLPHQGSLSRGRPPALLGIRGSAQILQTSQSSVCAQAPEVAGLIVDQPLSEPELCRQLRNKQPDYSGN